jgi:hypothetical protein
MFIFLNLTLHSFGPENFVALVQIGKFEKGLIEENESYELVYYTQPTCNSCWEKLSKTKTVRICAPTQYYSYHSRGRPRCVCLSFCPKANSVRTIWQFMVPPDLDIMQFENTP